MRLDRVVPSAFPINGLDLLNVSSYYQLVVKGVIIVAAVWLGRRGDHPTGADREDNHANLIPSETAR